jgi:lipopolysaccharide export system permease protein
LSNEESQLRKNKLLLEYWKKIFHPLTTVLLTLLAASFIFGSVRDNSLGRRILIGILFAFSLNTIQSLFQSMASVSLLNPFNSVFFPMLIVLLITMVLWNLKTQES